MTTVVYRNVDMTALLIRDLPAKIAAIHKETAKEFTAVEGFRGDLSVFAFRRNQKPRKYESIDSIPNSLLTIPSSIAIQSAGGENHAVEIATEFVEAFMRMAGGFARTGSYRDSLRLMLNGRYRALSSLQRIQASNPLKPAEIIEIVSAVEYASTLEAPNYNPDGIFLAITKTLIGRWGGKAAIRFSYRSGRKVGLGFKYMTPVIMISSKGEFATTIVTGRGQNARRRERNARKAKLNAINARRVKAGQKPLKSLPRKKKGA